MDDDFMDDAFKARMKQLQANPRPTPRKHTYSFHGLKIPCREGQDIPLDPTAWVQEQMQVHLRRCIVHYFQHVRPDSSIEPKKVFQEFIVHHLESSFRDCRPRFQRYTPGDSERSYSWFFMFCFSDWIHEHYPPTDSNSSDDAGRTSSDGGMKTVSL